jgi:type II secretion system protein N
MDDKANGYSFWIKSGFIIYILVCFSVFAYLKFPYSVFVPKIEHSLAKRIKKEVAIENIKPAFPFGFCIEGLKIDKELVCKEMIIRPRFLSLFIGRAGLTIHIATQEGSAKGFFEKPFLGIGKMKAKASMDNMDITILQKIFPQERGSFQGHITGKIVFRAPAQKPYKASGEAHLEFRQGTIPAFAKELPFIEIAFSSLKLDANMKEGLLNLEKLVFQGTNTSGNMNGTIKLKEKTSSSELNFNGEMKLPENIAQTLGGASNSSSGKTKFILEGKIKSPQFRVVAGIKQ